MVGAYKGSVQPHLLSYLLFDLFSKTHTQAAALRIPRYKVVVHVTLGELREQGIRVASRCLWDASTDNYASAGFKNVRKCVDYSRNMEA